MRKIKLITIFSVITVLLCSCDSLKETNIELYNYKDILIDKEYTELSQSDIETIIYMDFSSNDFFEEIEKDYISYEDIVLLNINSSNKLYCCEGYFYEVGSEELSKEFDDELLGRKSVDSFDISLILRDEMVELNVEIKGIYILRDATDPKAVIEFYGFDTIEETMRFIRKRASDEIVFNYMWDIIKKNSNIKEFPEYVMDEVDNKIMQLTEEANLSGKSLDIYLAEMRKTPEDIKQEILNYYYELIIAEEILKRENIAITDSIKDGYAESLAEQNGLSLDELKNYTSEEDIYYEAVMSELREVLLSYAIIK